MSLLTLYARKEPTTDSTLKANPQFARGNEQDVVLYSDAAATQLKARWPWHCSNKPDRRFKRVTLNCFRWQLAWLPDLV